MILKFSVMPNELLLSSFTQLNRWDPLTPLLGFLTPPPWLGLSHTMVRTRSAHGRHISFDNQRCGCPVTFRSFIFCLFHNLSEFDDLPLSASKTDMATIVKVMQLPDSGLEIRDRMWLKITIANAVIGEKSCASDRSELGVVPRNLEQHRL